MNNDVLYELLFFLCPKSLANFGRCCSNFNQLVTRFHKNEQSSFILCRWKYSYDKIIKNFQETDFIPDQHPREIVDMFCENRNLGYSICSIKSYQTNEQGHVESNYKFYLFASFTLTFFKIDVDVSDIGYIYRKHYIAKNNVLIYHFLTKIQSSYCSLIFDLNAIDQKQFLIIKDNSSTFLTLKSPTTKFYHCYDCHTDCPDLDINDLPYFYSGFQPQPNGDKFILEGPSAPANYDSITEMTPRAYQVRSESTGIKTPLQLDSFCFVETMFSDRYLLVKEVFNYHGVRYLNGIKIMNVITQNEFECFIDERSKNVMRYDFGKFSDLLKIEHKYYFSNQKLKDWFVLFFSNATNQWVISLIHQGQRITIPTFCSVEQRLIF